MKLKHEYMVMGIILCIGVNILVVETKEKDEDYCIIKGENVKIQQNHSVKSK
ncbi:MAG: hypothetical protein N3F66_13045 [Spirochaetes bacterium]|nr:hypothetical protein [Spirochaetota bacterium]